MNESEIILKYPHEPPEGGSRDLKTDRMYRATPSGMTSSPHPVYKYMIKAKERLCAYWLRTIFLRDWAVVRSHMTDALMQQYQKLFEL